MAALDRRARVTRTVRGAAVVVAQRRVVAVRSTARRSCLLAGIRFDHGRKREHTSSMAKHCSIADMKHVLLMTSSCPTSTVSSRSCFSCCLRISQYPTYIFRPSSVTADDCSIQHLVHSPSSLVADSPIAKPFTSQSSSYNFLPSFSLLESLILNNLDPVVVRICSTSVNDQNDVYTCTYRG